MTKVRCQGRGSGQVYDYKRRETERKRIKMQRTEAPGSLLSALLLLQVSTTAITMDMRARRNTYNKRNNYGRHNSYDGYSHGTVQRTIRPSTAVTTALVTSTATDAAIA